MKRKVKFTTLFFLIILIIGTYAYAIGNAAAIGTNNNTFGEDTVTTTTLINTAADCYDSCRICKY